MNWFLVMIIGGLAGFIASKMMKGTGSGILINVILGIVGSWLGSWLLGLLKISVAGPKMDFFISGLVGAVVLLFIFGLFSKKR